MFRWFKLPKESRVDRRLNRSSRRYVPIRLEVLEDRLAPATFNVTTLADGLRGSGSLRAAILESNTSPGPNTINLTIAGTYQLSLLGEFRDGTNGALQITNQSVTIANASGGSVIIDGGGLDRVFDIEGLIPGGVTFTGVTITGGTADNSAHGGDGGAIFSPQANVTLNSCQVVNNVALSEGGGIWTDTGNVILNATAVIGNTAGSSGGGIESTAGTVSITNSSVTGNVSQSGGGGIDIKQGSVTVIGSDISGNSTSSNGGGIALEAASTGNLTISNSTITDNVAGSGFNGPAGSGGGIYQDSISGTTSVTLSTIEGNSSAFTGGGIFTLSATVTVQGSAISGNTANSLGGGLDAESSSSQQITITGTTLSNNTAKNGAGMQMSTSAAGATLTVTNSIVNNNNAAGSGFPSAGGIAASLGDGSTVTVRNSTIDGNHCAFVDDPSSGGGGLGISCATLDVTNSSIDNNRAGASGGGVLASVTTETFTNVNVIGNHSGENGGGLSLEPEFNVTTNLSMTGCNISDNFAAGGDGGLLVDHGIAATFTNCTINGNHAASLQGGMGFFGPSLTMISCTISNNTSAAAAGGLSVLLSAGGSLTNCTISGNSAATNGGGIEIQGNSSAISFLITGCTISGNRAGLDGGGIQEASSGNVFMISDTLFGNTASIAGGGIDVQAAIKGLFSDDVLLSTISGNSAPLGGGVFGADASFAPNIADTIIAGNIAGGTGIIDPGPDVNGSFKSDGSNIIGVEDASCSSFSTVRGDQVGTVASPINPLLGSLENNGGPTFTMILRPGSPALNFASGAVLPKTDQRGFARPGVGQSAPSIGAFETQLPSFVGTSANGAYVENLYETLLGRTADAGGAGFVTFLNNGGSRATVVADIIQSTEYLTIEVQQLYVTYLHRAADPGGLQHFVSVLKSGGTIEQVAEILVSSTEYFQLHGTTNDAFVTALYDDALGRGGTPAEQTGFLQGLNAGTLSRAQVATLIFGSGEYQSDLVNSYYREFLGRNADAGGLTAWQAQLKAGMTDGQLIAALLGSGEGFAKRS
jgi:Right handed beta helix region/Domain of unknown function (DUF4214)